MNLVKAKWHSFTLSSGILPLAASVKGLRACLLLGPDAGGVGRFTVTAALTKKSCKMQLNNQLWLMFFFLS